MFAKDCIDTSIPYLKPTDTASFALEMMSENKTLILPVVKNHVLLGMVDENNLLEVDDSMLIEYFISSEESPIHFAEGLHIFDVLKKCAQWNNYFIPVLNNHKHYIGMTSPKHILTAYTQYSALNNPGGIIELQMDAKDYSLTEISKIVESNNAMILHSMISTQKESSQIIVAIKINKSDLQDIQATFERFGYTVVSVLHHSEYEMQLKERLDSLMRFLEV